MGDNKRVMLVVGARPQFVKAAALLSQPPEGAAWVLVHTGQHYDYEMSAAFFAELAIPEPAHNLDVGPLAPAAQLAAMTGRLAEVIEKETPAAVVVVVSSSGSAGMSMFIAKLVGAIAATRIS